MRKWFLITAVLVLSSAWVVAQNTPPSAPDRQQYPSTSQQPSQQPDTSQTANPPATGDHAAKSIQGCVAGAAGAYTLTDASGKSYQLAGDTSKLADHVGHSVEISGSEETGAGAAASAGAPATFNVKKVKMLSTSCPSK